MYINCNYEDLQVGEEICYHIGNLGAAREACTDLLMLTPEAEKLHRMATDLYERSTALYGTGEYALLQKKIGFNSFCYIARRLSLTRTRKIINLD